MPVQQAYLIDAQAREIRAVTYETLRDIYALIGGGCDIVEAAYRWGEHGDGDTLFVDEEGIMRQRTYFCISTRMDQVLAGSGVVVGREIEFVDGTWETMPPAITLDELRAMVRFAKVLR